VISVETAVLLILGVGAASAGLLFLLHRNHKNQLRLAAWVSTTAALRAAARTYDVIRERDEARRQVDELTAQNSSTEAKYAAAREALRIERNSHEQTRTELTQVKASHAELKTCAMEATSKAVEFESTVSERKSYENQAQERLFGLALPLAGDRLRWQPPTEKYCCRPGKRVANRVRCTAGTRNLAPQHQPRPL
jgi:hypothetical protein